MFKFLELLDTTLCCFLDEDDEKYEKEEATEGEEEEGESPYEKDVKKQHEMSRKVLPKVNAGTFAVSLSATLHLKSRILNFKLCPLNFYFNSNMVEVNVNAVILSTSI